MHSHSFFYVIQLLIKKGKVSGCEYEPTVIINWNKYPLSVLSAYVCVCPPDPLNGSIHPKEDVASPQTPHCCCL